MGNKPDCPGEHSTFMEYQRRMGYFAWSTGYRHCLFPVGLGQQLHPSHFRQESADDCSCQRVGSWGVFFATQPGIEQAVASGEPCSVDDVTGRVQLWAEYPVIHPGHAQPWGGAHQCVIWHCSICWHFSGNCSIERNTTGYVLDLSTGDGCGRMADVERKSCSSPYS